MLNACDNFIILHAFFFALINYNRHEFLYVNKISINLTPNACDIFNSKFSVRKY